MFVMVMVALGFGSYSRATFLKIVTEQLDLERGAFSLSDAIRNVVTAVLSIYFGRLLLRFDARKMIAAGFICLTASFAVNAVSSTYWQFYVGGVLLGIGCAWTTTSIVGVLVERWFTGNTGTITGFILAANGFGGFISENVVNRLIYGWDMSASVEDGNWRLAYAVTAAVFCVAGIFVTLLIRNHPSDVGASPLCIRSKKEKPSPTTSVWDGFGVAELVRMPYFYMMALCVLMMGFVLQGMVGLAKTHMQDVGIPIDTINFVFSYYSFLLLGCKLLIGVLFDRFGICFVYPLSCAAAIISLICMYLQSSDHLIYMYVYSFVAPVALPLETVMVPLLTKAMFGKKEFPRVLGYFIAINTFGMAVGTTATNWVYDLVGSYLPGLMALVFCAIFALVLFLLSYYLLSREKKKRAQTAQ